MEEFSAIGAAALVMDVRSGEIIAMASLPDFDPNEPGDPNERGHFNFNTLGVFEMGSTFKAFSTAMALDSGKVRMGDRFDARHPIKIGRFTINDFHAKARVMNVAEIFEHSSNIGTVKMTEILGAEYQRNFLRELGQLDPVITELPERGTPILPRNWGEVEMMTISFGHGIAVSPVHVVAGIGALSNGGLFVEPTVLKRARDAEPPSHRVISEKTSKQMNELFRLVVEKGTARKADVQGYPVGGKTGTAEKSKAGGYSRNAILSSFAGVFPADNPEYAILVMVDEPKGTEATGGYATGGWTAAPATSKIVTRIAPLLGVTPRGDLSDPALPQTDRASKEDNDVLLAQDR
jgi:cell division protein FtsI (penicillin-binding protein 3)